MALSVCLRKLEKASSIEDRIPIYKFLQSKKRLPTLCNDEKYIVVLTNLLLKDISSDNNRLLQAEALRTLQLCLCCEHVAESLNTSMSQEIIVVLTNQARSTEHPEMYTEFISTLSLLVPIMPEVMSTKLPDILECLERHFVKQYAPYVHVLCKVCHLFQRLITEIADAMIPHIKVWTPWVLFPLCHENNEVRDLAMKNLELCLPVFCMMEKTVMPLLVTSVKSHLAKEMIMLYPNQREYILKLWGILVTALGVTLHRGSSFINTLLEVVEKAFKSEDENIHIEALNIWQHLINNFATNLDVIGNNKRLKLLLQPLKLNIVRSERVAVAKCKTWWHIIWSLNERVNSNFELVCVPLLQYSFSSHLKNLDIINTSPATTRSGTKQSLKNSTAFGPKSDSLQKLGCEILSRLLEQPKWGSPGGLHSPKKIPNITLMPLKSFISNNVYVQHIGIFSYATKLAISTFGHDKSCASLNQYMLQLLTSRTARLSNDKDQSSLEAISEYFQFITDIVVNKQCTISQVIKLLEDMKMFPKEQLVTHILKVEYREKSCNTPLLVILSIMFESEILKSSFCNERYFSSFTYFLSLSQDLLVPLNFINSIMDMLKQILELSIHPRILCKMWSCICLQLLEIIEMTQEVNEGMGSTCDFTGCTMVLAFPVQHFLTCDILQVCEKQLWKNWSNLYKAFARCSALVPNAEANTACEIIAKMMLENVSKKDVHDHAVSLILFQLIQTVVDHIDYVALGKEFSELSPSNWLQQEEKPLHNITSFMALFSNLLSMFAKVIENEDIERKRDNKQLLETASILMNISQKLISNVTTSSLLRALILKLLPYLVPFFNCIAMKKYHYGRTSSAQFQQNMEVLWSSILTSLQLCYSGPYDSEFLEFICPLLEANLLSCNQNNVERTRQFWHATFGCNLHNLVLPISFRNALKKVKPPLIPDTEVSPIEDTSSSLSLNQIDKAKVSSVKNPKDSSEKLLKNSNAKFENFVVIKSQKNKQILTEHQKEKRRKRSYVPAMYNDLSQETLDIDTQTYSESSQGATTQETPTITIPSSTEDIDSVNKVQSEEKQTNQEPVIILLESEQIVSDEIQNHTTEDGDPCKTELSVSSENNEFNKKLPFNLDLSSSMTALESSSNNRNVVAVVKEFGNCDKNSILVGNLNQNIPIEETENSMKNYIFCNAGNKITDRLLVEDNTKDSKYITPLKQGMLRLIKNKKRLSNLFPKLSHITSEIESDLDENDAIPSSQESPNTMNTNNVSLNNTCKQVKQIIPQSDTNNDSNFKATNTIHIKDAAEIQISLHKIFFKSQTLHNIDNEEKVSQCSEALLNELGRTSSSSSKGCSEESVKIITSSSTKYVVKSPEMAKPLCSTVDITEESSVKDTENVEPCKQSPSSIQDTSDSDVLQSMQFSISSNNEFQHSLDILDSSHINKSHEATFGTGEKELLNDPPKCVKYLLKGSEPKRRSLRRLTPTRRVQEALLTKTKSSDIMNYKELLQSRNKSPGSRQQLGNKSENSRNEKLTNSTINENDNHDFNSTMQHSVSINENLKNSAIYSSISPAINSVLFSDNKQSDHSALNDLLTKPLTADCLLEGAGSDESNTSSAKKSQGMLESTSIMTDNSNCHNNIDDYLNSGNESKLESNVKCTDPEVLFKLNDSSPQAAQEQTPEMKSPISSAGSLIRHSQRQKANKTGKLKSIELEKLFSETESEKKSVPEHSSSIKVEIESLEAFLQNSTTFEKPKGARKRKNITPSPSSSLTSPVATRLRARSIVKQRVMQKSHLRGRPKSRINSLGIAHRHKPRRLSNVSAKPPTKPQFKDEEKLSVIEKLEKEENLDITVTKNSPSKKEESEKQDEAGKINEVELTPSDKVLELETNTSSDIDLMCKDEKKTFLPDSSRKRPLTDIKNCKAAQRSFNLPISPLSRSQKILRAAIGNFSSIEKSIALKSNKFCVSPNKSKNVNALKDDSSPDSSKFSSPHWAKQLSPLASPSTGILKRRRMTEDHCNPSPSPPQKQQRKVSFADPIVQSNESVELCDINHKPSRPVSRCLEMPKPLNIAVSGQKSEMEIKDSSSPSESSLQTSEEYQITPPYFCDSKEKVFPDLASCNEPVEGILPYLTCSLFPSGLGQLLCARNIFTIGDLCSLNISELLRLPIRCPKLETVRKALNSYLEIHQKQKTAITAKDDRKEQKEIVEERTSAQNSKKLLDDIETENNIAEHISLEKRDIADNSEYVEADDDIPLTPMSDSDNEDLYASCNENTRISRLEPLSELCERQNIKATGNTNINNGLNKVSQNNHNKSVHTVFLVCDNSMNNNINLKTTNNNTEMDIALMKDPVLCATPNINICNEEKNQMKTKTSLEVTIEHRDVNYDEKTHNENPENKSEVSCLKVTRSRTVTQETSVNQLNVEESKNLSDKSQSYLQILESTYSANSNIHSFPVLDTVSTDRKIAGQIRTEANEENSNTLDSKLEGSVISDIRCFKTEIKSVQSDKYEHFQNCAVEKLYKPINNEMEQSFNPSNGKISSETDMKSMQNDSCGQCAGFVNKLLGDGSKNELEENICNIQGSEAEINLMQNDFQKQYHIFDNKPFHEISNSKLEAGINTSNIRSFEMEIKSLQNDSGEQYPDYVKEKLHNIDNNEMEANFDSCKNSDSETAIKFKQSEIHEQIETNPELNNGDILYKEKMRSYCDCESSDQQQQTNVFDEGRESPKICHINVQGVEAETNVLNGTTAIEPNVLYSCDIQKDIIEIVNTLINNVNEGICEKDVNIEDNPHIFHISESSERTTANKNSNIFHEKSEKQKIDKEMVIVSKPSSAYNSATNSNDSLVNNSEEMTAQSEDGNNRMCDTKYKMSSSEKDGSVTEVELLQSVFTTENLINVPFLQLVDMMDKLTAAIRIKSKKINPSLADNRH